MNDTVNCFVSKLLAFCIFLSAIISNMMISFADDNIRQPTQPMTITVGKGEDRDFNSIQDAIDSINYTPNQGTRVTILIDEGTYTENIFVRVPYISLQNSGKGDVLITYSGGKPNENYHNDFFENYGMAQVGTVNITESAVGFTAMGIKFQNTYHLSNNVEQAQITSTALTSYADKVMFENCKFIGGQNTLYLGGASQGKDVYGKANQARAYLKDCYIEGTNDFIVGDATAVFDNCKLNMLYSEQEASYIAANTTLFNVGYVFLNSTFTLDESYHASTNEKVKNIYLGKPIQTDNDYTNYGSNVVLIKCKISSLLNSEAWSIGNESTIKNKIRFMEYNSTNESNTSINLDENRPDWVIKLTQEQAEAYTAHNLLRGNDGWNPGQDGKFSNPVKTAGVTIDKYDIELPEGEATSIKYIVLPYNADNNNVIFSSSDESVVTVDENGNITAHKSGNAKVTVTTVENKFSVSTNISVISNRTEVPQIKSIDIKNFNTETGKIESIYPGDILTGVYNYVLATDDKIDNAKVKWYTVDSKTGEEILIQEGRESFNKEYTVTSADIGCKIKFVVVPETKTNYGSYGKPVSYTTEVEVSKPDYSVPKIYLKENFSNFYNRKYQDLSTEKYPIEVNSVPIWKGTNNTEGISWITANLDGNDMVLGQKDSSTPSLLEYNPKEDEKPWKDVSLSTRMCFNLENRTISDDAYYDMYVMYNGKNNSYYKLRLIKGENLSSLKLNLYKKSGASAKETLIASEDEKLTNIIGENQEEKTLWFRTNISIKSGKITVTFSFEDKRIEPIVLTVVDNEPLSQGYIAFESYKSSILLDSLYVEELTSNTVANTDAVTVFIAGDSDSATYGDKRTSGGWGEYIQNYFDKSKVKIINKAQESKSSRNFINQGYLDEISKELKQGDYLFIQFGYIDSLKDINNETENYVSVGIPDSTGIYPVKSGEKISTPSNLLGLNNSFYKENYYSKDSGTFKWYLNQYIDAAKEKGAIPILVTPISRDNEQNNEYVTAVKQTATENGIKCIDMFEETKKIYEKLGKLEFDKLFDIDDNGLIDKSHYSKYGASLLAQTLAESIKKSDIEIGKYVNSETNVISKTDSLRNATLFIVGDSIACDYGDDLEYASPRKGWGAYIGDYLSKSINIKNLAVYESNPKDFISEENYNVLLGSMTKGDYLFIQFGYNDLNIDAYADKNTEKDSLKYFLYNYYIKPALEKGVNPVLISPVVTRSFDENYYKAYSDAVKELAKETNVTVIDMTSITIDYYNKLGSEQSKILQAIYNDNSKGDNGIDNEHLNQYGASVIAMLLAQEIKNTTCAVKNYISDDAFTNADRIYVKRADYIVMLMRILGKTQKPHTNFNDVSSDKYYSDAVGMAKEIGITNGDTKGNFNPEGYLSRQDMMVFTARALRQMEKLSSGDITILDKFTDLKYVDEYAKQDIADLVQSGIISGVNNRLDSEITLTKSQAASMILKVYNIK